MEDRTEPQRLREGLTELILNLIENGRKVVTKDGDVVQLPASPSDIREARAWLKEIQSGATPNKLSELQQRAAMRFQGRDVPVDEELVVEAA